LTYCNLFKIEIVEINAEGNNLVAKKNLFKKTFELLASVLTDGAMLPGPGPGRTFIKTGRLAILLARSHSEADSDTQSGSGLDTAQDEYRLLWLGLTRQSLVIAREETHFRSFMACASCQRTHGPCKSHHATIGYLPLRFSSVTQVRTLRKN
jgi:hypothetical protein